MKRNLKKSDIAVDLVDAWKYRRKESIVFFALIALASCMDGRAGAKIIMALVREACEKSKKVSMKTDSGYCATALSRLREDGLVTSDGGGLWSITAQGRKFLDFIKKKNTKLVPVTRKEADVIVIFDVPEADRGKRAELRIELVARGFFILQKSVWMGKGPIDGEFMRFLKMNNLSGAVHIFGIDRRGTI